MKQVNGLLGGKRVRVNRLTQAGSERVAPSWKFESLIWGISARFPLANHLALPGSESVFYLRVLPRVHAHLLAKMEPSEEAYG